MNVCETYFRLKTHTSGKIPCAYNKLGFNPGLLVQRYLAKLDPEQDLLFQVPLKLDQTKINEKVWFKDKLLPGNLDQVLTELGGICGLKKHLTVQDFKNARELYKQNAFFMNKSAKLKAKKDIPTEPAESKLFENIIEISG